MPSLREFQRSFHAALGGDAESTASLERCIRHGGLAPERRLGVYRNNMQASLTESLRATYPAVSALVGERFFGMLARRYIALHPSRSGDLHQFGDRFADFVRTVDEARPLPYLGDVCTLEWEYHRVFHAAEEPALDTSALADIPAAQVPDVRLKPHPASSLVSSAFPLTRIWNLAIHGACDTGRVDLSAGAEYLMVARRNLDIEFQHMGAAEFAFMSALQGGATLAECADKAMDVEPDFDVLACLSRQFARGSFTAIRHSGDPGPQST